MQALRWVVGLFRGLLKLVLPFVGQARSSPGLWSALYAVLHVLMVVAVVAGLHWVNNHPGLRLWPSLSVRSDFLARNWLPILFLLLYSLGWLSWWLYKLLTEEELPGHYPDIDQAWEEALVALREAGLRLTDLPLFLVLGRPEDDERALLQAAGLPLEVRGVPARADAPLRLYAGPKGVYLTCAGASLLGAYTAGLAPRDPGGPAGPPEAPSEDDLVRTLSPDATVYPDGVGRNRPVQGMADLLLQAEREGRPLSKVEKRVLRALYRKDNPSRGLLRDAARVDEPVARLRYLCRLVVRDRYPFCAVNGVLVLVPFAGTDSDDDAADTAAACQRDLEALADLRVHCPTFALVCDMETAPGFAEFVRRFSPQERLQRWGRSCPLVPDLRGREPGPMAQSLAGWICQSVAQTFVYRKFQVEKAGEEPAPAVEANGRLFLLFDELHERGDRLGRVLTAVVGVKGPEGPLLFGGCYLAGTGPDAAAEQAFVKGLLADRLPETEECVYWTPRALAEDAAYTRWVNLGWTALAVVVVVALAVAGYTFFSGGRTAP